MGGGAPRELKREGIAAILTAVRHTSNATGGVILEGARQRCQ